LKIPYEKPSSRLGDPQVRAKTKKKGGEKWGENLVYQRGRRGGKGVVLAVGLIRKKDSKCRGGKNDPVPGTIREKR